MSKKSSRLLALLLVFTLLFSVCVTAFAKDRRGETLPNKITVVTCGDRFFGRSTTITIRNTGDDPILVRKPSSRGCTVRKGYGWGYGTWKTGTVYPGGSIEIIIKTGFGDSGVTELKLQSAYGTGSRYSYSLTCSDGSPVYYFRSQS